MENVKKHGPRRPPPALAIPKIVITDYDADLANQQLIRQEISQPDHVQANQQLTHHEISQLDHINDSPQLSPKNPVTESEEEDREIIDSLTKAHSDNSERHIDVDDAVTSQAMKIENPQENLISITSSSSPALSEGCTKKKINEMSESATDDYMADLEVSHLTSLFESTQAFPPLDDSLLNRQKIFAKFIPMRPPPGNLPDISDIAIPRYVPVKKVTNPLDPAPDAYQFYGESSTSERTNDEMAEGAAGCSSYVSRVERSGCLPSNNGETHFRCRRTVRRLIGEGESDSSSTSPSDVASERSDVAGESSDERPPEFWTLYDSDSTDKSDGGNKDDINQILQTFHSNSTDGGNKDDINQILQTFHVIDPAIIDDSAPGTSKDLTKATSSSSSTSSAKQSEDVNKK